MLRFQMAYEIVAAAASSSCSYRRYELVLVREIPPCSGSGRWRYPMACTIHNSKKKFPQGWEGSKSPILVHARRTPRFLPPTSRLDRPRVSQSTCNLNAMTREEVSNRGASAHLLLVATKFSVVVALQGVATTYHDALKFSKAPRYSSRRHVHQHKC